MSSGLLCQEKGYEQSEKLSTAMLNAIVPEVQNSSELEKAIDEIEKVEKIESYTAIMTGISTLFYNE